METNINKQKQDLKAAEWFAKHNQIDMAISIIDDVFHSFTQFRAWYLTNLNPEYGLHFDEYFVYWVAKIMVVMYNDHCPKEIQKQVYQTYMEILKYSK